MIALDMIVQNEICTDIGGQFSYTDCKFYINFSINLPIYRNNIVKYMYIDILDKKRGSAVDRSILIIEDEPAIVTLIKFNLEKEGYKTDVAYDGEEGIEKLGENTYDLVVLDLMLPKVNGIDVCKRVRQEENFTPILMLTAKDNEYDKVHGLEMGADDYLTKPFSPKELVARIQAILRRTERHQVYEDETLKVGDLVIAPKKFEADFKGEYLELTRKEFELLVYLIQHKGQILSREQLLSAVWGYDFVGDTRIVDVQVSNIREKIEEDTRKPRYIKTVRGFGYKLEEPK